MLPWRELTVTDRYWCGHWVTAVTSQWQVSDLSSILRYLNTSHHLNGEDRNKARKKCDLGSDGHFPYYTCDIQHVLYHRYPGSPSKNGGAVSCLWSPPVYSYPSCWILSSCLIDSTGQ